MTDQKKISIPMARQSIEHIIAQSNADAETIEKARHGCHVLKWLEDNHQLVQGLRNLHQNLVARAILETFPGSSVSDVQPVKEGAKCT